jgi:hypothetical protein
MLTNKAVRIGDCEVCDKVNIEITVEHGNITMCANCAADEKAAVSKSQAAQSIITASAKIDESIQIKTDIFVTKTTALVELRGAIEADDTIPADKKEYTYAKICLERFQHLQKVVFEQRKELLEKENEMRLWQVNAQEAAGKLRAEARAEFKALDISYQPITPATPKPKAGKSPATYKKEELVTAAKKHNVPADVVRMTMISKNLTAENAAKYVADLMAGK